LGVRVPPGVFLKKRRTLNIELPMIQNEFLLEHSMFDVVSANLTI